MRIGSVSVLVLAAFALAACEGTPTTGSSASNATLDLCGLNCPDPVIAGNPTPPVIVDPDDETNTNTGNTANFTTGDTTIALEKAVIKSPAGGSLSQLTLTPSTPDTPNRARLQINTRTANNSRWPVAKTMDEYEFGTNASGGVGLGGTYKEYRILNGAASDEELQVWTWGSSYGTQYREVAGGDDARRQAWSFGGTRTTNMPPSSAPNAIYSGRYGATSKTWNWVDNIPGTVDINNSWRVEGTSNIVANFGTSRLTGTLTPTRWNARDSNSVFTDVFSANPADPNWASFMNDNVVLNGVIAGNTVSGAARLDPAQGWINGTNPMYAGFFGAGASEVTGVYNFLAVNPDPIGGDIPINDDGRGFVQQSGVFNGQ